MLKRTAFYEKHLALGAKIVPFAGYEMPIQYKNGIIHEHKKVRESVGVFDVSHMGEVIISGDKALEFVNYITINDASKLEIGQAQYSAMCYDDGGIVDDLLVYRRKSDYFLVINASNIDKDVNWMNKNNKYNVQIDHVSDQYSQLAVQGKNAEKTLQKLTDIPLAEIKYYWFQEGRLATVPMIISRTGYTGEPGFELYFDAKHSSEVWDAVFNAGAEFGIEAIGLGARDSLRMEKKMALYGNDIDQTTNPIEAGLAWICKTEKAEFIGKESILKIKSDKVKRKLVSLLFQDKKAFPRQHYKVFSADQIEIGEITSGTVSPILGVGIAIAYVASEYSSEGTELLVDIRNQKIPVKVIKAAFV